MVINLVNIIVLTCVSHTAHVIVCPSHAGIGIITLSSLPDSPMILVF